MDSGGSSGGARGTRSPSLFLDQTEDLGTGPPPGLSKRLDDRPFPPPPRPRLPASLSQGLDPALLGARYLTINE